MTPRRFIRLFVGYFFKGLLYVVPIGLIVYVTVQLFLLIDGWMPADIPGLGAVVLIALVTAIGYFGSTILGDLITKGFNRFLDRAPLFKSAYNLLKDFMANLVGKKRSFKQPVLVKLNRESEVERLGFVTAKDLTKLGIAGDKVAVMLPMSYSPTGDLFIVPSENVTPIDAKPSDVMKFVVSGGVADVEQDSKREEQPPKEEVKSS